MARAPVLEVEAVEKRFGETRALAGVDLATAAGQVVGLLGPNGAGKTTLVRIVATLVAPDRGSVRVGGHDVVRDPAAVRRTIGLAGQNAGLEEKMTGRENLVMAGRLYQLGAREARRRADEVLERFGLTDVADRRVETYSGGMRRRIDLGASLVGRPRLLLLDEPTTGLDPRSRAQVWEFVRDLAREGAAVLLTTQYLEEADELAQEIVVIDHGRVIAADTPEALKRDIGQDVLEIVLGSPAALDEAITLLAGVGTEHPAADAGDCRLTIPLSDGVGALAEAIRRLDAAGIPVIDAVLRRPSLDDVFLALTGHHAQPEPEPPDESLASPAAPRTGRRAS
jgi:ABC-2 type transport system ATP-binding protein